MSGSRPAPYAPGFDPKILAVARRSSPCRATSAATWACRGFTSAGSSKAATVRTASSSSTPTCGNASRKKPLIRTVTSTRGRPISSTLITSKPVTRRDPSSHVGRAPSSASTSAMSSPCVRIALVPHTVSPTLRGHVPVSARNRSTSDVASATPVSQASRDGIAFGSTE